jgi:hypothetical protein
MLMSLEGGEFAGNDDAPPLTTDGSTENVVFFLIMKSILLLHSKLSSSIFSSPGCLYPSIVE